MKEFQVLSSTSLAVRTNISPGSKLLVEVTEKNFSSESSLIWFFSLEFLCAFVWVDILSRQVEIVKTF